MWITRMIYQIIFNYNNFFRIKFFINHLPCLWILLQMIRPNKWFNSPVKTDYMQWYKYDLIFSRRKLTNQRIGKQLKDFPQVICMYNIALPGRWPKYRGSWARRRRSLRGWRTCNRPWRRNQSCPPAREPKTNKYIKVVSNSYLYFI